MKTTATAIAALIALSMVGSAAAQGRHDEKPHGSTKPSTTQDNERQSPVMTGGRHDERPHGMMTKPKTKAKASDEKEKSGK
jgi:hypothetical protein